MILAWRLPLPRRERVRRIAVVAVAAIAVFLPWAVRDWLVFDIGGIIPVVGPQAHAFYTGLTWNVGQLWGATPRAVVK